MNSRMSEQSGFTAIELLVTLFIAVIFLFAGYQLYTQVIKDGTEAERTAQISSDAYEKLRQYTASMMASKTGGCSVDSGSSSAQTNTASSSINGTNVNYTIELDCPFSTTGNAVNTYRITVTGVYTENGVQRTIKQATYASK